MTVVQALLAFSVTRPRCWLTITPWPRHRASSCAPRPVEGPKRAALAAVGIGAGCLAWGAAAAVGLAALLQASAVAFTALKWVGAAYLVWLGIGMLLKTPRPLGRQAAGEASRREPADLAAQGIS